MIVSVIEKIYAFLWGDLITIPLPQESSISRSQASLESPTTPSEAIIAVLPGFKRISSGIYTNGGAI